MEIVKGSLWTDVGPTHGSSVVKKVAGGMGFVGRNSLTSRNPKAWALVGFSPPHN